MSRGIGFSVGESTCRPNDRHSFSEGQEEARTTKEDVEDASGGEQERGLGEKGRHESIEMESGSSAGVNPATPVYGDKPGSKLD